MSNFPTQLDTDIDLPRVDDNITEIGADAINALRAAVFAIEGEIGIGASGTMGSIATRLGVSIDLDGSIKPAALTGLGLVTLPIDDSEISSTAAIQESKLNLQHGTQDLFNLIVALQNSVDILDAFISVTGIKVEPHIAGTGYRHLLSHIDVDSNLQKVNISTGTVINRNITNAFTLAADISNDLLSHEKSDGSTGGTVPPANFGHNASGIYINPSNFSSIPQTEDNLQGFAEFVDKSSLSLLGSRTQNLYSNGVPRNSRVTSFLNDKAAEAIVDATPATTYLLFSGSTIPVDDISHGDDVIVFNPSVGVLASNNFDAQFAQVKSGDFITVDYGNNSVPVTFTIDSVKVLINGSSRTYAVRINGKNLFASTLATARIDRPFYHDNRFGQLAVAAANNQFSQLPSLVISNPRSASALGLGFNADKIDQNHYNLYLTLYPTGSPVEKTVILPAIDVTGNQGATPGQYTLDSIIQSTNDTMRRNGFNLRFSAFSYQGEFGIMLSDHYNNVSFSITSGTVDGYGNYTSTSNSSFPANVIDIFNGVDPLGFGTSGANIASPPYAISYASPVAAQVPTSIFSPLKRSFFYVDGVERDTFALEVDTAKDIFGDGYWNATLLTKQVFPNRVEVTYQIDLDLETSGLKIGKTLVVQPAIPVSSGSYSSVDYGRFTISNVTFTNCPGPTAMTTITVYDAIHGTGNSPFLSSGTIPVLIYFSDDSVGFNLENVSDSSGTTTYKRFFEILVNSNGKSFSHERARVSTGGSNIIVDSVTGFTLYNSSELANINLYKVSSKLRGYKFDQYKKITCFINNYDSVTGVYDGYLCRFDSPGTYTHLGPTVSGKKGEKVRFYDETSIDFIDIIIEFGASISSFSNKKIDIQLFPTLSLNEEKIFIGSCQVNDTTKIVNYVKDEKQFGNVSEKQLSTSALDFISSPQRLLHENGVIRGFDDVTSSATKMSIRGGLALVNGKIVTINDSIIFFPPVIETLSPSFTTTISTITWFVCANEKNDIELIASTDYDTSLSGTYGSLDHNRIFYVNKGTNNYPVRGTFLQNLVTNFKDVTPLYAVSATVTSGAVSSISTSDIRRFVSNGYGGLEAPFVLSSNGSFRSVSSLYNYIQQLIGKKSFSATSLNKIGTTVLVKDRFDISGSTFEFPAKIKFVGDSGVFDITSAISLKNVEFENITFNVSSAIGFNINGDNVTFNNCTINYTYDATTDGSFTSTKLSNITKACILSSTGGATPTTRKKIRITNTKFTNSASNRFAFVSLLMPGETDYYEDIIFSNNNIVSTTSAEDKRAAFIIATTLLTTPVSLTGPRIVNCRIENNVFNKNQLILISGSVNPSNKITTMPVPVNVSIEKNTCGAICYLTRQDRTLNTVNTSNLNDKDNIITITKNICRYIYCGTSDGFINVIGVPRRILESTEPNDAILTGSNIYTSSAIVSQNVCSWIQIGVKGPTSYAFETPMLEVSSNKLNAYLSTFLDDYRSGAGAVNIGLIVDNVVGT